MSNGKLKYTQIEVERDGPVTVIRFNRPDVMNCIGLANEVVPRGEGLARAMELAKFIASLPQTAIRTDKEAAVRGFGRPLDEGLRFEAECFHRSFFHPDTVEGLRRFRERDHPDRKKGGPARTPGIVRG